MTNYDEVMNCALKAFMRVRDEEIEALNESNKKELAALRSDFESQKRKMVQEIIDLELDNKELLKKIVGMNEQADVISSQAQEIANLKTIKDQKENQLATLTNEIALKDGQIKVYRMEFECLKIGTFNKRNDQTHKDQEIENLKCMVADLETKLKAVKKESTKKDEDIKNQEFQINIFRQQEEDRTVHWLINHEKSPKLQFPQCCYYLAEQAVECFKKGERYSTIPSMNGITYLCEDKFYEILSVNPK